MMVGNRTTFKFHGFVYKTARFQELHFCCATAGNLQVRNIWIVAFRLYITQNVEDKGPNGHKKNKKVNLKSCHMSAQARSVAANIEPRLVNRASRSR